MNGAHISLRAISGSANGTLLTVINRQAEDGYALRSSRSCWAALMAARQGEGMIRMNGSWSIGSVTG